MWILYWDQHTYMCDIPLTRLNFVVNMKRYASHGLFICTTLLIRTTQSSLHDSTIIQVYMHHSSHLHANIYTNICTRHPPLAIVCVTEGFPIGIFPSSSLIPMDERFIFLCFYFFLSLEFDEIHCKRVLLTRVPIVSALPIETQSYRDTVIRRSQDQFSRQKSKAFFWRAFFWRGITAREQIARAVIHARF